MIKIQMKRYGKTVEVPVMSGSEDVYLALWKLGLDRDMEKYTLEGLEAVFLYDTPLEHQMIRTISSTMKLRDALYVLNHLITPPEPIAMELWDDLRKGYCHTSGFVMREIQRMIEEEAVKEAVFTFPIIGEMVDSKGYVTEAPMEFLVEYREMIDAAFRKIKDRRRSIFRNPVTPKAGIVFLLRRYRLFLFSEMERENLSDPQSPASATRPPCCPFSMRYSPRNTSGSLKSLAAAVPSS